MMDKKTCRRRNNLGDDLEEENVDESGWLLLFDWKWPR